MKQAAGAPLRMDNGGPGHPVPSYSKFGLATRFASALQSFASRGGEPLSFLLSVKNGHPRGPEPVRVAVPAERFAQDAPGFDKKNVRLSRKQSHRRVDQSFPKEAQSAGRYRAGCQVTGDIPRGAAGRELARDGRSDEGEGWLCADQKARITSAATPTARAHSYGQNAAYLKFAEKFQPFEAITDPRSLFILVDNKSGARFCECHIKASKLVPFATTDVPLDPDHPEYRANRELVTDTNAFAQMKEDALAGRTFSNIVAEYIEEDEVRSATQNNWGSTSLRSDKGRFR